MSQNIDAINQAAKDSMRKYNNAGARANALLQHTIDTVQAIRDASNAPGYTLAQAQADADAMIANMKAKLAETADAIANGVKQ